MYPSAQRGILTQATRPRLSAALTPGTTPSAGRVYLPFAIGNSAALTTSGRAPIRHVGTCMWAVDGNVATTRGRSPCAASPTSGTSSPVRLTFQPFSGLSAGHRRTARLSVLSLLFASTVAVPSVILSAPARGYTAVCERHVFGARGSGEPGPGTTDWQPTEKDRVGRSGSTWRPCVRTDGEGRVALCRWDVAALHRTSGVSPEAISDMGALAAAGNTVDAYKTWLRQSVRPISAEVNLGRHATPTCSTGQQRAREKGT